MRPYLNLRRQRLAARLSQMVTAKPLCQLIKAGVYIYVNRLLVGKLISNKKNAVLRSVPTLWTQGNCLGWGPSDRTGLVGTEYHRTLYCVVRALQSLPRRQLFSWPTGLAVTICDNRVIIEKEVVMTLNKQVKKQAKKESRRFAQRLHQERKNE